MKLPWSKKYSIPAQEVKASTTSSISSPEAWFLELMGGTAVTSAGAAVTPANAMQVPAVRCAVETIAEAIGQLPVHVHERGEDGSKQRAPNHPVEKLLADAANEYTPAAKFREQLTRDALLHGNGYAAISRVDGKPRELIYLPPTNITVKVNDSTGEPVYENGKTVIPWRDIIHIAAPSLNGYSGDSPVRMGRDAIGLAKVMETHASRLFANAARPSGVIQLPPNVGPNGTNDVGATVIDRMQASWNAMFSGSGSGKTAILEGGATFQPLTFTSTDAQFLELRKFANEDVARIWRVPPSLLMEMGRATWNNADQMRSQFVDLTLMRWIKAWEGELRLKLFDGLERETFFVEFNLDDFLRSDIQKRAVAYGQMIAARIFNPNEIRAMENRAPYPGGDEFLNPNTTASPPPMPRRDSSDQSENDDNG